MSVVPTPISVQPKKGFLDFGVYKKMREQIERLVVLPFSIGCNSQNSVAVVETSAAADQSKKPNQEPQQDDVITRRGEREGEEKFSKEKRKNGFWFLGLPSKLMKSIRSISQVFVRSKEENETDSEMEIGFPTDVKHVTHIGLDGSTTTNHVKGWENLKPPELISFPSISFRQFELAMAAQAHGHRGPLVGGGSSNFACANGAQNT